jgi:hypothetical protein
MGMRQLFQLRVFRAWIEDNALGTEPQNVVLILFLERRAEIERHRIDVRNGLLFRLDVDVTHLDPLAADGSHRMPFAAQSVHSQIAITLRVIGSPEHQCLFWKCGHKETIQPGTHFVQNRLPVRACKYGLCTGNHQYLPLPLLHL